MTQSVPASPALDRWLTLGQAARLCGVHPVTLRLWADRGLVPYMRTAGGHRRFSQRALRQRLAIAPPSGEEPLVDHGLEVTRERLGHSPISFATRFDDAERDRRRADGRALLGLVMHYAGAAGDDPSVAEEAHRIGERYAAACLNARMPLTEAVTAALFFRDALIESALETPPSTKRRGAEKARVITRINEVLNAYLLGLVGRYEAAR